MKSSDSATDIGIDSFFVASYPNRRAMSSISLLVQLHHAVNAATTFFSVRITHSLPISTNLFFPPPTAIVHAPPVSLLLKKYYPGMHFVEL